MRPLTAAELLAVWERGQGRSLLERALMLLAAASPGESIDALAALSIGQRDGRLLTLREWMFGARLESTAACSRCSERLEMAFKVADLRAGAPPDAPSDALADVSMSAYGYELEFRLPTSIDLGAISELPGPAIQRRALFERCLTSIGVGDQPSTPDQAPAEVIEAVAARMAELDPQADVQVNLLCPACQHRWQAVFDIALFFWNEIEAWAWRILREVHILASAYGWSEHDILALGGMRRQIYLSMVGA